MNLIRIDGKEYRLAAFLNEDGDKTTDPSEACVALVQDLDDIRPEGVKQKYMAFKASRGSFVKMLAQ